MTQLEDLFHHLLQQYGVMALFVTLFLETLGLPVPGESALTATATASGAGQLKIWHVAVAAWSAAMLGDNTAYLLGRRLGRPTVAAYGSRVGITEAQLIRAESVMDRFGFLVVMAARFLPLLRQLNGLVAGTTGMRWHYFLLADAIGSAAWVGVWGTIGYKIGHTPGLLPMILSHLKLVAAIVVPLLILALIVLTILRRRGDRKRKAAAR